MIAKRLQLLSPRITFFLICIEVFYVMTRDQFMLMVGGFVGLHIILTGLGYLSDGRPRGF